MANTIQVKRGAYASLPTLAAGEFGWCTDTNQLYMGTGSGNHEVLMQHEFNANTILAANTDNTPAAVTVAEQTVVGRLTSGNITAVSLGIADNNIVQMDDADAADNDFAKFTANGLEGRSYSEVRSDLGLVIGTNVLAQQTIGIANDNLVEMDDTDAADNDYAKFTSAGLEGRSYAEVLSDLSGQASSAFSFNSQTVSVGTPTSDAHAATKLYVDDLVAAGLRWVAAVLDKDTLSPPGASTGDRYWIGGTGSGAWAGHDYEIAEYNGATWDYTSAADGMTAYVTDEDAFYFYNGDSAEEGLYLLSTGMGSHASTHITGGGDEIDGDKLDIDWNPSYYTPSTTPSEADSADNLTAHLYGIDQALNGKASTNHASGHITGGSDQIDGDKLDIDWTPSYYTPSTNPSEADNVDNLTAHLYGIDQAINGKASTNHDATHVRGGSDEIDGDTLDIDYTPSNYTPTTSPAEVTNVDELTAHLAGIDSALSALGSSTFTGLTDTPANYTSAGGYILRVNSTPNAVEFVDFATTYLDDTPGNGDTTHAPTANWAYDHDVATTGIHGAGGNTLLHSGSTIDGGSF